jgi:hypothetical protein
VFQNLESRVSGLPLAKGGIAMMKPMRLAPLAASFVCLTVHLGCGGGSSTTPTPVVQATPIPCTRTPLFQGSGQLPANTVDFESFTTTATGRVDVSLDWTFASSTIGVAIAQGPCSFAQLQAGACTLLLQTVSPPKPLKASVSNVAAGTYGLIILNPNSVLESMSLQVFLSSSTCPAAASGPSQSAREPISGILRELTGILGR